MWKEIFMYLKFYCNYSKFYNSIFKFQEFLGLKHVITEKHFYFNLTKGFPCLLKSESRSTPHCLGKTKGRSHPHIDPVAIERLRDFYRPFNERFYQLSGINFGWPWNVVISLVYDEVWVLPCCILEPVLILFISFYVYTYQCWRADSPICIVRAGFPRNLKIISNKFRSS